jgi:hypothetical protein
MGYSDEPVSWKTDTKHTQPPPAVEEELVVAGGSLRQVRNLGEQGAVALTFESTALTKRWKELRELGLPSPFDSFLAHVTITFAAPAKMDLDVVEPFEGDLMFGPEVFTQSNAGVGEQFMDTLIEIRLAHLKSTTVRKAHKTGKGTKRQVLGSTSGGLPPPPFGVPEANPEKRQKKTITLKSSQCPADEERMDEGSGLTPRRLLRQKANGLF